MPVLETLALTAAVASLRGAHRAAHRAVVPRGLASKAQRARIAQNRAMRKVERKLSAAARKRIGGNLRRLTLDEVKALNADAVNALFTNTAGGQPLGVVLKNALSRARARDRATDLGTVFKANGTQRQPWAVLFNAYAKLAKINALPKKISSSSKSATKGGSKKGGSNKKTSSRSGTKSTAGKLNVGEQTVWDHMMRYVSKKVKRVLKKLPAAVKRRVLMTHFPAGAKQLDVLLNNKASLYRTLAKNKSPRQQRKTLEKLNLRPTVWYRNLFSKLQDACERAGVKITKRGVKPLK